MIYKYKDPRVNKGDIRLVIKTGDIAFAANTSLAHICTDIHRNKLTINTKDLWNNFWNLVTYLEAKGIRPIEHKVTETI